MSPPIYTPDGSEVNEIVLPDGSTASQVIGPDGNVVFEAGPDIPDSVVAQYYASTFSTGNTTWDDDATSDGAQDISLSGDAQESTLSDGSESVAFDTSDHGLHDYPIGGSDLTSWAIEFALSWSHDRDEMLMGANETGGNYFQFRINIDKYFSSDPGNFNVRLSDADRNFLNAHVPNASPLNDGNRHDISVIYHDTTQNDMEIIIDGSTTNLDFNLTQNPDNFASWGIQNVVSAFNDEGTTISSSEVDIGAIRWHNQAINSQTISDYP